MRMRGCRLCSSACPATENGLDQCSWCGVHRFAARSGGRRRYVCISGGRFDELAASFRAFRGIFCTGMSPRRIHSYPAEVRRTFRPCQARTRQGLRDDRRWKVLGRRVSAQAGCGAFCVSKGMPSPWRDKVGVRRLGATPHWPSFVRARGGCAGLFHFVGKFGIIRKPI